MNTVQKLLELSSRIEHLETSADWITKETVHTDNTISQTATLIMVLADDIREKVYDIVKALEQEQIISNLH